MRFITLSLCTFFYSILSIAQAPIAHWDMNGTANDVTGRGHTGHMTNVTPVAGMSGLPNTAYAFNGTNSMITSGYLPDLNASKFTICATIMVKGFYSGLCQDNVVIVRGNTSSSAISFVLDFSDNYFDPSGSACTNFDPTSDVFSMIYGGNAAPSGTALQYHPTMQKDKWYRVVSTFDGITFRIFINDTLKNTYTSAGAPFVATTDSIAIGYDIFGSTGTFPYPFNGIIDDIKLYDRVLSDSEILIYGPDTITCGSITKQPATIISAVGSNIFFDVVTTTPSPFYQWQQDAGLGYADLSDAGVFSGVKTNTLKITSVPGTFKNYHYRCIISGGDGCSDTSKVATLNMTSTAMGHLTINPVQIYPNPSKNKLTVTIPTDLGESTIQLTDALGRVLDKKTINNGQASFDLSIFSPAIYILKTENNGQVFYNKIIKE